MSLSLNRQNAVKEWKTLLESKYPELKGSTNKLSWLSEYCTNHSNKENAHMLNESFNYGSSANLGNTLGMGSVMPGAAPGGVNTFYKGNVGSGDKFPSTLPIAMQVAVRTVGFDIVGVIPMSGPTGILPYMDYVYSGGKMNTSEQPLVIKIASDDITNETGGYTVNHIYWGLSTSTPGVSDIAKCVEMIYVGKSIIDGENIFRIGNTYTFDGTNKTLDESILISQIFDTTGAIALDNSGNPDATTGNFVAVTAKAQYVKALEDHIQGFSGAGINDAAAWSSNTMDGGQNIGPMSRATGESTYYRNMTITAFTKFIEAETYQASATVTTEQIQDMNTQWGIDVLTMVENALINEVSQSINKHILSRAFALGWSNNSKIQKIFGTTLNFTTRKTNAATATPAYLNQFGFAETLTIPAYADFGDFENLSTMQRRVVSKVFAASNIIAQRGRRGRANFVVTNVMIASALQDNAQYSFSPMANTISQDSGNLYPIGTLGGMEIFVDPNMGMNDNRILVGRKGSDEEPGLKFCPYLLAETISTIAEGTMAPKIAVKSRYALVEAGFHPETQYLTIYCDFGPNGIC